MVRYLMYENFESALEVLWPLIESKKPSVLFLHSIFSVGVKATFGGNVLNPTRTE
ncbi:MAG: hypothetical protein RL748_1419 [Pseudomonadota bacterium]|jgi:hypothetical protein